MDHNIYILPFVRKGLNSYIDITDDISAKDNSPKAHVPIRLQLCLNYEKVNDSAAEIPELNRSFELLGPGDVRSVNSNAFLQVTPSDGFDKYCKDYMPMVEFFEEDFPWRYTPLKASEGDKLRPWMALIICKEGEFDVKRVGNVEFLHLNLTAENYKTILPDIETIHLYAHAQIMAPAEVITRSEGGELCLDNEALNSFLHENPDLGISRIFCNREQESGVTYTAFLIPTFELGRLAGLGCDREEVCKASIQQPAWEISFEEQKKKPRPFDLPIYYRWSYRTFTDRFSDLANKLHFLSKDDYAALESTLHVNITDTGLNDYKKKVQEMKEYIDVPVACRKTSDTGDYDREPREMQEELEGLLNRSPLFNATNTSEEDPWVVPPVYGAKAVLATSLNGNAPSFVKEVNLNFQHRIAAGLGRKVVQKNQEEFVHRAWCQVERVNAINQRIREFCQIEKLDAAAARKIGDVSVDELLANGDLSGVTTDAFIRLTNGASNYQLNPNSIVQGAAASPLDVEEFLLGSQILNSGISRRFLDELLNVDAHQDSLKQYVVYKDRTWRYLLGYDDFFSVFKELAVLSHWLKAKRRYTGNCTDLIKQQIKNYLIGDYSKIKDLFAFESVDVNSFYSRLKTLNNRYQRYWRDSHFSGLRIKPVKIGRKKGFLFTGNPHSASCLVKALNGWRMFSDYNDASDFVRLTDDMDRFLAPYRKENRADTKYQYPIELYVYVTIGNEKKKFLGVVLDDKRFKETFQGAEQPVGVVVKKSDVHGILFLSKSMFDNTERIKKYAGHGWGYVCEHNYNRVCLCDGKYNSFEGQLHLPFVERCILREKDSLVEVFDTAVSCRKMINASVYENICKLIDAFSANEVNIENIRKRNRSRIEKMMEDEAGMTRGRAMKLLNLEEEDVSGMIYAFLPSDTLSVVHNSVEYSYQNEKREVLSIRSVDCDDSFYRNVRIPTNRNHPDYPFVYEGNLEVPTKINLSKLLAMLRRMKENIDFFSTLITEPDYALWYCNSQDILLHNACSLVGFEGEDTKMNSSDFLNLIRELNKKVQNSLNAISIEQQALQTPVDDEALEEEDVKLIDAIAEGRKKIESIMHDYYKNLPDKVSIQALLESRYPVMAYPEYPDPTYFYLNELSSRFILPSVDQMGYNKICYFYNNPVFEEAFLCGMNTEMGKELLWREYPTDERGSYFRKFWDSIRLPVAGKEDDYYDVKRMHQWKGSLGENHGLNKGNLLIFVVRGDLMQVYPQTQICLTDYKPSLKTFVNKKEAEMMAWITDDTCLVGFRNESLETVRNRYLTFYEMDSSLRFQAGLPGCKEDNSSCFARKRQIRPSIFGFMIS